MELIYVPIGFYFKLWRHINFYTNKTSVNLINIKKIILVSVKLILI